MARKLSSEEQSLIDLISGKNDPIFSENNYKEVKLSEIMFDEIKIFQDPKEKPGDWMKTLVCAHEKFTNALMIAEFDNHEDYVPPLATLFSENYVKKEIKDALEKGYQPLRADISQKVSKNYGVHLNQITQLPESILDVFNGKIRIIS